MCVCLCALVFRYLAAEAVRAAGLRAPKQLLAVTEDQVRGFWISISTSSAEDESAACVLKPDQSVGGDQVVICCSLDAAIDAFRTINGQFNALSTINRGVLCMEYIEGTEYHVDTVSRDGVCKV
jgi:biotin carboxylase